MIAFLVCAAAIIEFKAEMLTSAVQDRRMERIKEMAVREEHRPEAKLMRVSTRLEAHLQAFRALTREKAASGKRMEFLLQEILREVNTTGSKANHLPLTQCVLEAKAELEKLREQAANVE